MKNIRNFVLACVSFAAILNSSPSLAMCVQLYESRNYVGCRVYDEKREIAFDSDQVAPIDCFTLCAHWEKILAGTAQKRIKEPRYAVPTNMLAAQIDSLHRMAPPGATAQVVKECGKFEHGCHLGNPRGDLKEAGATYDQVLQITKSFIQLNPGVEYVRTVNQVSADGRMIETMTPIGEKHSFEVLERSETGDYTKLRELPSGTQIPSAIQGLIDILGPFAIRSLARDLQFPTDPQSEETFIKNMILRHRGASPSARMVDESTSRFDTVSRLVLQMARTGRQLREQDLEDWNKILLCGLPNEEEQDIDRLFQFVIRGVERVEIDKTGRQHILDSNFSTFAQVNLPGLGNTKMFYLPSTEVPARMTNILNRVNSVDRQTPFSEICQIYRDFIIAHPFFTGNGRTGRFVLEFALLKGGYQSIGVLPREILFRNKDQFELILSKTLKKIDGEVSSSSK